MAGYSGTPLVNKLGVKENSRLLLVNPPANFTDELIGLPTGATVTTRLHDSIACTVVFVTTETQLNKQLARVIPRLAANGGLWLAWPKKASKMPTDLDENIVRRIGLRTGLVDNKICAINEVWSGLRFVIRLKDRPR
ncbi:MAG: DUF3052 domain-containing protein [Pyrinomonadaceae bacterium]